MRRTLLTALIVLALAPLGAVAPASPGAREAPEAIASNPLAGHLVTATMPELVLVLTADRAGVSWAGPLELSIDGRPAARMELPTASAPLPRRRWGARDYLVAAGVAVGAGILGAGLGYVAGALR